MSPQLAWIGLGNMGRGMCKNLTEKGSLSSPLLIYNRTASRANDLAKSLGSDKVIVSTDIPDLIQKSDIIFTCVGDDAAIQQTIDAALKGNVKGKLFVDCSTVHPDTTELIAEKIIAAGAEFVASPVFGAPAMADAGLLLFVLAGAKEAVEKVKPYTKGVMGRADVDFSDQPFSQALNLKIIGNSMILNVVESLAEAHVAAEKVGLGGKNLHSLIELLFPGPYAAYSNRMLSGDYYNRAEPLFAVDLALKDAGHAMALAKSAGTELKAAKVANDHLKIVKEQKGAKGDLAGIYGAVRLEAGLKYENGE